jgi:hypothetical protein
MEKPRKPLLNFKELKRLFCLRKIPILFSAPAGAGNAGTPRTPFAYKKIKIQVIRTFVHFVVSINH